MRTKDDNTWQDCYAILRAHGRSHMRALEVLRGNPTYKEDKPVKSENIAQEKPFNQPFTGSLWQV